MSLSTSPIEAVFPEIGRSPIVALRRQLGVVETPPIGSHDVSASLSCRVFFGCFTLPRGCSRLGRAVNRHRLGHRIDLAPLEAELSEVDRHHRSPVARRRRENDRLRAAFCGPSHSYGAVGALRIGAGSKSRRSKLSAIRRIGAGELNANSFSGARAATPRSSPQRASREPSTTTSDGPRAPRESLPWRCCLPTFGGRE